MKVTGDAIIYARAIGIYGSYPRPSEFMVTNGGGVGRHSVISKGLVKVILLMALYL